MLKISVAAVSLALLMNFISNYCSLSFKVSRISNKVNGTAAARKICLRMSPENDKKKIVFLGTPSVAATSLKLLVNYIKNSEQPTFEIPLVVSNPPSRSGRGKNIVKSPVHQFADENGIAVLTPATARDPDFIDRLGELAPDLCITAAYGQIFIRTFNAASARLISIFNSKIMKQSFLFFSKFLPQKFLDIPRFGTLNIHPSLLPKYRGASPVQRCLQSGESITGVTVLFTVLKMDSGPILEQSTKNLNGNEKATELLDELFKEGTELLLSKLPDIFSNSFRTRDQNEEEATDAPKLVADEAQCYFDLSDALTIHNKVRAFSEWPGTWAYFSNEDFSKRKIKLITTEVGLHSQKATNYVSFNDRSLEVTCHDSSVLRILEVQPEGKKVMSAKAFMNGLRDKKIRWIAKGEE